MSLDRYAVRDGRRFHLVFALIAAVLAGRAAPAAEPRVTAVRYWSFGDVTRVAIETESEARYQAERVENPDRLVVDLPGVRRPAGSRGVQTIPVHDKLLKQIRLALWDPETTRVVLDLTGPYEYSVSQLTNPHRLIVEVRIAGPGTVAPPVRSQIGTHAIVQPSLSVEKQKPQPSLEPAPVLKPAGPDPALIVKPPVLTETALPPRPDPPRPPALTAEKPDRKASAEGAPAASVVLPPEKSEKSAAAEVALAAKRDSHGDRSLIRALGLKLERVVIDPGHGGHDTGTIGRNGLMEKELVLDVARRLGVLITKRLSSEVILTRTDDTFIPLEERTHIANDRKADLFLSIHANSSSSPRIAGSETFYLNLTTSADALEVAARENATSQMPIHELQTLVQQITLNEKVQESREFAGTIQNALVVGLPRNRTVRNRGVKKAPFVVLVRAQMPAVLAEIAFLSNPRDEGLLKRPEYRQRIAEALFKGVSQYASTLSHFEVAQRPERSQAR